MTRLHQAISLPLRSSSSKRLDAALDDQRPIAGRTFRPSVSTQIGSGTSSQYLGVYLINYPHVLVSYSYAMTLLVTSTIRCDLLISDNILTDAGAALRDEHLSGITSVTGEFWPSTHPQVITINRRVPRWSTFYKFLAYNNTGGLVTIFNALHLIPLCAR